MSRKIYPVGLHLITYSGKGNGRIIFQTRERRTCNKMGESAEKVTQRRVIVATSIVSRIRYTHVFIANHGTKVRHFANRYAIRVPTIV